MRMSDWSSDVCSSDLAFALGLPPATSRTLQLNSGGSLAEGTIKVDTKWVRRGGLPVRADIAGARLREGGRVGRIPEPIYSAFQAALAVNAADDPDQRRAAFAELRSTLGDDIGTGIEADGFLARVRIAYAANFSLNAKADHGRFDFYPVLFSRKIGRASCKGKNVSVRVDIGGRRNIKKKQQVP